MRQHLTLLSCLLLAGCTHAAEGGGLATIGGVVQHPAKVVPALRVCASPTEGGPDICADTRAHADRWQLRVPAGEYQVFAWPVDGARGTGAYLQPVQCIRAPCPPMPSTVRVGPGEVRDDIDLTGFDPARTDLPDAPPAR